MAFCCHEFPNAVMFVRDLGDLFALERDRAVSTKRVAAAVTPPPSGMDEKEKVDLSARLGKPEDRAATSDDADVLRGRLGATAPNTAAGAEERTTPSTPEQLTQPFPSELDTNKNQRKEVKSE